VATGKRRKIHPGIAITAMVCISALAIVAELTHSGGYEWLKVVAAGVIMTPVGIKVRTNLPLT